MSDLVERLRGDMMTPYQATQLMDEAAARIEKLEAALRCVEEACDALMVMEDGETLETLTGYSRGAYFTAKYIKTRAALEASDDQ